MNTISWLLVGFVVSAVLPATALAQDVTYDFNPNADFSRLKTYTFNDRPLEDRADEGTTLYDSPFVRERTHAAIAAQLEGRGLTRDDVRPDINVATRRTFKTEYVAYPSYGWGWGYPGWGWGYGAWWPGYGYGYGFGGATYIEENIIGTLTIDIQNASTGELMWRGAAEKEVSDTSKPEKRAKKVLREVTKIFKRFPPVGAMASTAPHLTTAREP